MRRLIQALGSWGLVAALSLFLLSCGEETTPPERTFDELTTDITAGPEEASTVAHGSPVTFAWIGRGGMVPISGYAYALDDPTAFTDWASVTTVTLTDLAQGEHTFYVKAYGDTTDWDEADSLDLPYYIQTTPTTRSFEVGLGPSDDTIPPQVWFVSGPAEGSKHTTGSSVTFAWDGSDSSEVGAGSAVHYTYALDDTSGLSWTVWGVTTTATCVDLVDGEHTFYVRASDAVGNKSLICRSFTVMPPTILLVDNATDGAGGALTPSEEATLDKWYRDNIVRDYAYEEWDTADKGWPTAADMAPFSTVIWYNNYTGNYDSMGVLVEYLDGGGNVWLSDFENLWAYGAPVDTFETGHFAYDYLKVHIWLDEPDLEEAIGLVDGYPDLKVFASPMTNGNSYIIWVDQFEVASGADAVYAFNESSGPACGLRSTGVGAAGAGSIVYFAFPLWPMPPEEMRQVAVQVLTNEFGE